MKLETLDRRQILPIGLGEAWRFFSDPANLPLIIPPSMKFETTLPPQGGMYEGMILTYSLRPFPMLDVTWLTEITHICEPRYFVDEQRLGPYSFWHHKHFFREVDNGVEVRDLIHWAMPLKPFSNVMLPVVKKRLDWIFDYRRDYLVSRFGTERVNVQATGSQSAHRLNA